MLQVGCLMWTLAACSSELEPWMECGVPVEPGSLVITEIMSRPVGEAAWLELYNPGSERVELGGLMLIGRGGGQVYLHKLGGSIAPEQYLVVGGLELPDEGSVVVTCGVAEIDAVTYPEARDGVAWSLGSGVVPHALLNDDPARWCFAVSEYSPGNSGTPGAANDCVAGAEPAICTDERGEREAVRPVRGDLVITEIMADPAAVADATGEWFEILARRDVDLNGLAIGRHVDERPGVTLQSESCLRAAAGQHLVIARSEDGAQNGGLPQVDYRFVTNLGNSSGSLYIGIRGEVLDEVSWSRASAGVSASLDPEYADPESNDDALYWCAGRDTYGAGDRGTPGAANPGCAIVVPGHCRDGGSLRPVTPLQAGQVRITEYMANPDGVDDSVGEWIELRVDADADLNGLQLGRDAGTVRSTIEASQCLHVSAGTHVVIARNADASRNGGLPRVDALFGFSLVNSAGRIFIAVDGVELDAVSYSGSSAGAATSLDEGDGATWCINREDVYGIGANTGTPGAPNPRCGS